MLSLEIELNWESDSLDLWFVLGLANQPKGKNHCYIVKYFMWQN